ncbi:MAG: cytochrome P450 [Solirubrobacterales bacterium]|nr:cytochrome P450 [Solirubrobacterales bacterium]
MSTLPPGPRTPQLLQWLSYGLLPYATFTRAAARYGDTYTMRMMGESYVVLGDPEHVKEVFTGSPDDLYSGEANRPLRSLIGERNVLLLDGPEHLRRRRLVLPPFHGERMRAYEDVVRDVARRELASWPQGAPLAVLPHMRAITFEVILRAVFGVDERPRLASLQQRLDAMLAWLTNLRQGIIFGLLGPERMERQRRFRRELAAVDAEVLAHVAQRRADPALEERADVLSMLLLARDEDGRPLTDQEVRDELVTLLTAGHETTSALLAWAIHDAVRTPGAMDRLAAREDGWAEAVVRESLRLRPPIPLVVRRLQRPMTIAGLDLPAGATVAPCAVLAHRRAGLYPDPEAFRPERFLGAAPPTYGWLPFGGGVRRCIGAAFAQMEARLVLEELAATWLLRPASPRPERVGRRGIVIVPARGGRVVVTGRRPAPAPEQAQEPDVAVA